MIQSQWAHTSQRLSWTAFSFILLLKQTQDKCIKRSMHDLLNRGDKKQNSRWDGQQVAVAA